MQDEIDQLVTISRAFARDPFMVQAGGGNSSVKSADGRVMVIKASGHELEGLTPEHGHVALPISEVLAMLDDQDLKQLPRQVRQTRSAEMLQALLPSGANDRPSLEAGFHVALDRLVLHLHPVAVNAITCAVDGQARAQEMLAGRSWTWVDYAAPGYELAVAVREAVVGHQEREGGLPEIVLLASHGVVISGDTVSGVLASMQSVQSLCVGVAGTFHVPPVAVETDVLEEISHNFRITSALSRFGEACLRPTMSPCIDSAAFDVAGQLIGPPICPDDVVYTGTGRVVVSRSTPDALITQVLSHLESLTVPRSVIVIEGAGVLLLAPDEHQWVASEELLAAHVEVCARARNLGGVVRLSEDDVGFLQGMEGEEHRQQVQINTSKEPSR